MAQAQWDTAQLSAGKATSRISPVNATVQLTQPTDGTILKVRHCAATRRAVTV